MGLRMVLQWVWKGLKDMFRDGIGGSLLLAPVPNWMGFKTPGLGRLSAPGKESNCY